MASNKESTTTTPISTTSYETALCIIPPQRQCTDIDKLRSLYDKDYGKWPSHINLIHPFVSPENLPRATSLIESHLHNAYRDDSEPLTATLDNAGMFKHRKRSTVFLHSGEGETHNLLSKLRGEALRALGQPASACNLHLTIGQSEDETYSSRHFLMSKAELLPGVAFAFKSLAILVRERTTSGETADKMRLWGTIKLHSHQVIDQPSMEEFWLGSSKLGALPADSNGEEGGMNEGSPASSFSRQIQPGTTYRFHHEAEHWSPASADVPTGSISATVTVSSYNVLIDSEYPPARERDPLLVRTILDDSARADVLFLQEVSDDFLSYLLSYSEIREQYPFTSHGPPSQADIGPLPSLRNIVVLSRWYFEWEFVPFHRRHKGAVVAKFPSTQQSSPPFAAAGVHLTCGLTDGSVAAKKVQLLNLINHLKRDYPTYPWVIAGDFNLATSRYTIDQAVSKKSISQQTARTLSSIETVLSESSLLDAWSMSKVQDVDHSRAEDLDDLFEGEEGATFNPRENALAAAISGTSRNRPQRYDRILVRPQGRFSINRWDMFGLPEPDLEDITQLPSDHSGIRATLNVEVNPIVGPHTMDVLGQYFVKHRKAPAALSGTADLVQTLSERSVFPTSDEEAQFASAFTLIKRVILDASDEDASISDVPMIIVPVGSYALGVWTPTSDIDCLCVGSISSKTFFQLARQRIHRAESKGVRLLRKVEANTGTMLELSVNGVNIDLQYCPAASVVQRWSTITTLQPSDPIFNLSVLSLRKLKPFRDLAYMQRTLPSMKPFRLAYHFIKLWAIERGIYSAKFGYFCGTHITLMLSWVYKRLAHDTGSVSAPDLVVSFFHHYANFDWQNDMVFDTFFHKKKPRYHRTAKEPMVVLGHHTPNSNTAHTATVPGVQVLTKELQRADELLSSSETTWNTFFDESIPHINAKSAAAVGTKDFLVSHGSYVKIDIQYWGRTLSKGRGLVGWVESRCINLVVDIHKALPSLSIRIWPARFANTDSDDPDAYYSGCYLIGISRNDDGGAPSSKEDRAKAKAVMQKTFDRFLDQIRADERHYDASSCWVDVSLAKSKDVRHLSLDDREWGDYVVNLESDSEDEEDEDDAQDVPVDSHLARKLAIRPAPSSSSLPVSSSKLRPASDILHRLRWDSNLDPSDYIVGYIDRFLGAKEISLERWKTEQTDDEFIPQHRILYFKKRNEGGGEVVWERATRVDKIFGSGVGDGASTQ